MLGIICLIIQLYLIVVFIRIIMSWFPPTPGTTYASIFEALRNITEPVLAPVRSMLPPFRVGAAALDLSPIVIFIVGSLLIRALC